MDDNKIAAKIAEHCSTYDPEANGCHLDAIIYQLLRDLGYNATVEAAEAVDCWRA